MTIKKKIKGLLNLFVIIKNSPKLKLIKKTIFSTFSLNWIQFFITISFSFQANQTQESI